MPGLINWLLQFYQIVKMWDTSTLLYHIGIEWSLNPIINWGLSVLESSGK